MKYGLRFGGGKDETPYCVLQNETLDTVVRLNHIDTFLMGFLAPQVGVRYDFEQVTGMIGRDDSDPLAPQREAAIFYGLFLRGHPADDLRRDIDVPRPLLNKWLQPQRYEDNFRDSLRRMYTYRKKVLAIFDELVLKEKYRVRIH